MEKHDRYTEVLIEQRSDMWLLLRKGKITGSNFGAALDVDDNKTSRQLQRDMSRPRTFFGNKYTRHGTFFESYAIDHYKSETGHSVADMGFAIPHALPWIGVSPDGIVEDTEGNKGLLEIKCPCSSESYGGVPEYYQAQIQGLMGVLNLPWCDFVVYRPPNYGDPSNFNQSDFEERPRPEACTRGRGMEVHRVQSSLEYQKHLFKGLRWFWSRVVSGEEIPTKRSGKSGAKNPHRELMLEAVVESELTMRIVDGVRV